MEKILIAIKQVPDTMEVKIDPETNRIVREGVPSIVNPYDMYAIEAALRLREAHGGEAIVFTMGPPQAESALREALSLGADRAFLLSDREFAGSDTLATSYTLAAFARRMMPVDLIVCGREALDGSTGQVGPETAENLDWPFVPCVSEIRGLDNGRLRAVRLMEDHYEVVESELPAVITVAKEIAEPRMPSLKGMMKARKAEITTLGRSDLPGDENCFGAKGSPTWVTRVWTPEEGKHRGRIFEGEPDEVAAAFWKEAREKQVL